jgi:DNA-binding SARP family transcriptional activator
LIDPKTPRCNPDASFTVDVAEFEEAVKTASQATDATRIRLHLEQTIALYRGDLLPNCVDEWIEPERERLRQLRINAIKQLIDLLKHQQDYRTAIAYAQQLLQINPLYEAIYVTLMQLYEQSGDRTTALQVYYHCMTTLREELGIDPSATTRALYQRILEEEESLPPQDAAIPATLTDFPMSFTPQQDWGDAIDASIFYGRETERSTLYQR